jgi:hypothetical protein
VAFLIVHQDSVAGARLRHELPSCSCRICQTEFAGNHDSPRYEINDESEFGSGESQRQSPPHFRRCDEAQLGNRLLMPDTLFLRDPGMPRANW